MSSVLIPYLEIISLSIHAEWQVHPLIWIGEV